MTPRLPASVSTTARPRRQKTAQEPAFFSAQISRARRFYLDLNPRPAQHLAVVCAGVEHCRPDYHLHRATFPYCSIEFVAHGAGWLRLGGRTWALAPGSVFAYAPAVAHDIRCDPGRPLIKYFLDFAGRRARGLLSAPAPGRLVQSSAPDEILRLFEDLIAAGLRPSPLQNRVCAAITEHLLLRVAETAVAPGTIDSLAFATYRRCRRYAEEHFLNLHSLADLASACGMDRAYLCRLFARFDHQSPYQYLTRLKMLEAAQQLQEPAALVKQVAARLGYPDPFQFSRVFHRVMGVSPRQFQRLHAAGH